MLKLCKVTKVKVLFPVLVLVFHSEFNFNSFKSVAAILEKLGSIYIPGLVTTGIFLASVSWYRGLIILSLAGKFTHS